MSRRIHKGNAENTRREIQPPKIATWLLKSLLREELFEDVAGDLEEKFVKIAREKSTFRARINYWYQVINYMRLFAFRKNRRDGNFLLKNNIKISWRHLKNQPLFSSINIGGLTIGITACILITLYIQDELSYDQHLSNNIYRLYTSNNNDGVIYRVAWHQPPMADVLRNEVPEIESIARINTRTVNGTGASEVRRGDITDGTESFFEEGIIYADPQLIDILELKTLDGNRKSALMEPMTMVITQRKAQKYFPNEDAVGKLMIFGNNTDNLYRIDAVIENPPANSHLQYDFILTLSEFEFSPGEQQTWHSTGFYNSYIKLHDDVDVAVASAKMTAAAKQHMSAAWSEEFLKEYNLGLQPVQDIHLYSADMRGPTAHGDIKIVWVFGLIAIGILLIAGVNFINLSTAKSANRAKEVGIRKVVGSVRRYLVAQFLTEAVLFSVISFGLACILAALLLPQFNRIAGTAIEFPWKEWWFVPGLTVCALAIGILAGIYPALYLSAYKPISVLKGNLARGAKASTLRSTLVVFQFTTSIILIIATVVIYRQIDFMLNRKPGFDKEQVLLLHGTNSISNTETLKQELLRLPNVESVTVSDYLPVTGSDVKRSGKPFWLVGAEKDSDKQTRAQQWSVDHDYVKTMGMKIVEGRDFDANMVSDSNAIIINQRMVKDLGLNDSVGALGQQVVAEKTWTVIGVVEDFNFESLRRDIRSLGLVLGESSGITIIRIAPGDMMSTVGAVEDTWHKFSPNQSIRFTFLDDSFSKMYDDVLRTGNIFTSFAAFAMIVACLGLFALSAFMIEQRGKELSIRLLFGATVRKIFGLLTVDFLKLIVISIVISLPIAAWMAKRWLEGFHYRIDLTWDVFAITGLTAIGVAMLTVSYQSIRAGLAKPVDKLRSE